MGMSTSTRSSYSSTIWKYFLLFTLSVLQLSIDSPPSPRGASIKFLSWRLVEMSSSQPSLRASQVIGNPALSNLTRWSGVFSVLGSQVFWLRIWRAKGWGRNGKKEVYLDSDNDVVQAGLTKLKYDVGKKKKFLKKKSIELMCIAVACESYKLSRNNWVGWLVVYSFFGTLLGMLL